MLSGNSRALVDFLEGALSCRAGLATGVMSRASSSERQALGLYSLASVQKNPINKRGDHNRVWMAGTTDNPKCLVKSLFGETELRTTDAGIMSKEAAHKVEAAQFMGRHKTTH